ncbi:MAG: hypothetical protein DRH33_06805 [Candidatus Nealsonbacteria bacterium]|nr:MAG: hypothetical protein DRH33_06805 [Candidatus Nealsonbacteria bacterium]
MNTLVQIFNTILYQPLLNALILLYHYLPGKDFGVAILVLTVIIKLILHPSSVKAIKSQKALSSLQPKLKELQRKYKNDQEKLARATLELYQKEKISPFSGCLPLLLQLPILIALYRVFFFLKDYNPETLKTLLYNFVPYPGTINLTFLGIINLAQPNFFLALIAGILQYFQSKISIGKQKTKKGDFSSMMQSQMLYFFPVFTVLIVWKLGAIIGLYWIFSTLFSIGEQYLINKKYGE